jgi:hypothetical protein
LGFFGVEGLDTWVYWGFCGLATAIFFVRAVGYELWGYEQGTWGEGGRGLRLEENGASGTGRVREVRLKGAA